MAKGIEKVLDKCFRDRMRRHLVTQDASRLSGSMFYMTRIRVEKDGEKVRIFFFLETDNMRTSFSHRKRYIVELPLESTYLRMSLRVQDGGFGYGFKPFLEYTYQGNTKLKQCNLV